MLKHLWFPSGIAVWLIPEQWIIRNWCQCVSAVYHVTLQHPLQVLMGNFIGLKIHWEINLLSRYIILSRIWGLNLWNDIFTVDANQEINSFTCNHSDWDTAAVRAGQTERRRFHPLSSYLARAVQPVLGNQWYPEPEPGPDRHQRPAGMV